MGDVGLSDAAKRALERLESATAWFYLRFLAGEEDEGYLEAATVRMYREEYAALPAAVGVNEAAVRAVTMPVKLKYF